jgi:pseudaminic acid biosynthesis-associated methylase
MNKQLKMWQGDFGTKYIDRNFHSPKELDRLNKIHFGLTRTQLNTRFLGKMNRNIRILEVGCNVGNQLLILQKMGFKNLYGIEINRRAIERSKKRGSKLNILWSPAQDIPFKDGYFDLVFTAGVLIHIPPSNIRLVMKEMHRCSSKYIWGYESYAEKYQQVNYRGHKNMYWKTDFCRLFEESFPDLQKRKVHMVRYANSDKQECMYLLKKKG